jgi:hypothetical protein
MSFLKLSAFESPQAAGAFVCMCTVERNTSGTEGIYCALEVSELGGVRQKTKGLLETAVAQLSQCDCIRSSDHEILLSKPNNTTTIGDFARSFHGITTTDLLRFSKLFWESNGWTSKWVFQQGAVDGTREIGGREAVLLWENGAGELKKLQLAGATVVITGLEAWVPQRPVPNPIPTTHPVAVPRPPAARHRPAASRRRPPGRLPLAGRDRHGDGTGRRGPHLDCPLRQAGRAHRRRRHRLPALGAR